MPDLAGTGDPARAEKLQHANAAHALACGELRYREQLLVASDDAGSHGAIVAKILIDRKGFKRPPLYPGLRRRMGAHRGGAGVVPAPAP